MGQSYRKTKSLSESYHLRWMPYLCLWRRNFCTAGGVLLWLQRCDFRTVKKPFPLSTAAQNIHVFRRKSPLHKIHFFEWLKTANFSTACGTSTLKGPLLRAFSVPDVHPRPRKRLARCTLDCGFKTSESPALRGFVAERCPITGTSLYLVIFSNGLRHSKNLPVKFGFSSKTVPANIVKKLPPQRCSKPHFIAFFSLSHKRPTFAFTGESGYTLGFRRRIAHSGLHAETGGVSDGGGITTLGAFHTVRKPCVARYQNSVICRFGILVGCALEEHRKPAGQRCAYACRCPEASRPRWAAHTYAVNTSIFPAEFFSHSQKAGKKSHSLMFHIHVFDCTA